MKVGVAVATVAFLGMPLFAQAQYAPPPGYEGMTPPPGFEGMTPPTGMPSGAAPSGQMGPPADVQSKMASGLERLKKNTRGMQHAIDAMTKAVNGVSVTGFVVPADITASIEKAKSALLTIQNASTMDDAVLNAIDDFTNFTDTLDANIENLMLLSKFPRIMSGADRAYTRLQKFFDDTVKRLANSPIDLTQNIAGAKAKVDALKAVYDKAVELSKSGKAQDAFDQLENNFFPGLEDASQTIGLLNAAKGVGKASAAINRGLTTAQNVVNRLVKEGVDATDAQAIVDEAKAKFVDFKGLVATKDFDLEKAMTYLEDMDALRSDFMDKVDALVGSKDVGKLPNVKFFSGTPSIPVPVDMRNGFDAFKGKTLKSGGIKEGKTPSESMGIDMGSYGAPAGIPAGY